MPLPRNKRLPYQNDGRGNNPNGGPRPMNPPGPKQNNGGKGKGKKKGGGNFYGGLGGYRGVNKNILNRLVNGILRDEMRDMRHQSQGVRRDYRQGLGDLRHIHQETGGYLNHLMGQTQQMYEKQGSNIDAATAALQDQLVGTYGGAQGDVSGEMARLGIGGAANTSGMSHDAANAQALAAISGANASSTLDLGSGNAANMGALLQGMNQGSYQQGVGQNLLARNESLQKIRDAVLDVKGSRSDVFFQLLQQMQQTGWDQFLQQQQLKMQRKQMKKK